MLWRKYRGGCENIGVCGENLKKVEKTVNLVEKFFNSSTPAGEGVVATLGDSHCNNIFTHRKVYPSDC
jgi:hypothetical protein